MPLRQNCKVTYKQISFFNYLSRHKHAPFIQKYISTGFPIKCQQTNIYLKNTSVPFFKLISPKTRVKSAITIAMSNAFGRLDKRAPALDYKLSKKLQIS